MRFDADFSVIGWLTCAACSITTLSVVAVVSLTFTPPVCVWMNTCTPLRLRRGPHRVEVARVVRLRRRGRQQDRAEPGGRDAFDLRDRVVDVGERDRRGRRDAIEVRREPLDDVVVVDACVRHRQLVVVGVEAEQREVRVHHLHVDAVEVHVLEDDARDRPRASGRRSGGTARPSSPRSPACAASGRSWRRPRRTARSRSPLPTPRGRGGASAAGS